MMYTLPFFPPDSLSLFMLVMICLLFPLVFVYSLPYVRRSFFRYYSVLLLTLVGMLGTVLAKDLLSFYVFLEIMTVGVYFLIIDNKKKESFPAGFKYILMMFTGGVFILLAALMLYNLTGTFELAAMAREAPFYSRTVLMPISTLFVIGCLIQIGAVPFHIWLPDAHPIAPSPVSALLSGLAIKIGAYGIIRLIFTLQTWDSTLIIIGVSSMLFGVALALRQTDIKRLLAYHSISQMGYVLLGIGAGTGLGIGGALFHVLNHAIFKMLLFLCMGAVIYATGERELNRLGGLGRRMPLTLAVFGVAALAISGMPPLNGFASKALLSAAISGNLWLKLAVILTAAGTFASFFKLYRYAFWGELPEKLGGAREVPLLMSMPMLVLAAACLAAGLFSSQLLRGLVAPALGSKLTFDFWNINVLIEAVLILGLGAGIYAFGMKAGFFGLRAEKAGACPVYLSLDRLCCGAASLLEKGCSAFGEMHSRSMNIHLFWVILALTGLLIILNFLMV